MGHVYHKSPEMGIEPPDFKAKKKVGRLDAVDQANIQMAEANAEAEREERALESAIRLAQATMEDAELPPEPIALLAKERNERRAQKKNKSLSVADDAAFSAGESDGREDAGPMEAGISDVRLRARERKTYGMKAEKRTAEEAMSDDEFNRDFTEAKRDELRRAANPTAAGELERNLPGAEMNLDKLVPRSERAKEKALTPEQLFKPSEPERAVATEIKKTAEVTEESSERWYTRFAQGAKKVSSAAGELFLAATGDSKGLGTNIVDMVVGKNGPSIFRVVGEYTSVYDTGKAFATAATEIGSITKAAAREALTREKARELKEASEDYSPTYSVAGAAAGAARTLREIFGGAAEAGLKTPGEFAKRSDEAVTAAKYVLGGGFLKEVYGGVRDTMSGKQKKEVDEILHGVEGELIFDAPDHRLQIVDKNKPGKTWTTDGKGEGPGETWESPLAAVATTPEKSGLRRDLQEVAATMDKAGEDIDEFLISMPRALFEVAKFGGEGVVDLGKGYGKMFSWVGEQLKAGAAAYKNFESKFNEASLENQRAELRRQALLAGAERMGVAAQESNEIAGEAVRAKVVLVEKIDSAREGFLRMIDEAEAKLVRRNKDLDKPELNSKANKAEKNKIRSEMAQLERDLNKYEAAIAAIDAKKKRDAEDRDARRIYQQELATAKRTLAIHEAKLNETSGSHDMAERKIAPVREQIAKYESILSALDQLDAIKPEDKKESALA